MIPSVIPLNLTTSWLDTFIPGFVKRYGQNVPVIVHTRTPVYPKALFNVGEIGMNLTLELSFQVFGEIALVLELDNVVTLLNVTLEDFILRILIESFSIGSLTATKSLIGDVSTWYLETMISIGITFVVPIINSLIGGGLPFPQNFFDTLIIDSAAFLT